MLYHDAAHGAAGAEADGEADKLILEKVEMPGGKINYCVVLRRINIGVICLWMGSPNGLGARFFCSSICRTRRSMAVFAIGESG